MIEPGNPDLSIGKQCKLLSISRSSFYYQPKGETALNLALMRQIDEQFLETPFFGVRQMTWHLRNEGHLVNTSPDAADGPHADLPEAQHQQGCDGAQDLSISALRSARGSTQPGLGGGHHLWSIVSASRTWVTLPCTSSARDWRGVQVKSAAKTQQ